MNNLFLLHSREQQEAELDRQWEERLIGAFLPAIPDINILVLNKCRYVNVASIREYSKIAPTTLNSSVFDLICIKEYFDFIF